MQKPSVRQLIHPSAHPSIPSSNLQSSLFPNSLTPTITEQKPTTGFWLSLASIASKSSPSDPADLKDGLGHSWPEYGSEGDKMVLFGDVRGGAAEVVAGDYFDGVYMCGDEEGDG